MKRAVTRMVNDSKRKNHINDGDFEIKNAVETITSLSKSVKASRDATALQTNTLKKMIGDASSKLTGYKGKIVKARKITSDTSDSLLAFYDKLEQYINKKCDNFIKELN